MSKRGTPFVVAALLLGAGVAARAQTQVKGRVMVIVDTSGSMVWHFGDNITTGGDGDARSRFTDVTQANKNYYPGDLLGNGTYDGPNSRLYAAKQALTAAVSSTGDIDFGLTRFQHNASTTRCPDALNCCSFNVGACICHGDYSNNPGGARCTDPTAGLVTWSGGCGPIDANGLATDGGQVVVRPAPGSGGQVLRWVDGVEDFRAGGAGGFPLNGELRGAGPTPLAGSVRTATYSWYKPILDHTRANPNCDPTVDALCDPQIDCRPYVLVVMTDGRDDCDTDWQIGPPFAVDDLWGLNPRNPVLTYVIGLAFVPGDPARAVLDDMALLGGTSQARFAADQGAIESAFADIVAASVRVETCNGIDDNCNGVVDEGFDKGAVCSVGTGACLRAGIKKCDGADASQTTCCFDDGLPSGPCVPLAPGPPATEVCNGVDDDCDGLIDEGGVCQQCTPTLEVCDGLDNDCDGVTDDHLVDAGQPCGLSLGRCTPGITACVPAGGGPFPDATDHLVCQGAVGPTVETCNGLDDDCDGVIDGMLRPCYGGPVGTEGVGPCTGGEQACTASPGSGVAAWGACAGELLPAPELCNDLDDDCDGTVDNLVGAGDACCPSGNCTLGACREGIRQCLGGSLQCVGGQGPLPEACNGLDDDCNGATDDLPGLGNPCRPVGGCGGTLACDAAQTTLVCRPSGTPQPEVCNGLDDDCDGVVDESVEVAMNDPLVGKPCGNLPLPCLPGKYVCKNGAAVCQGAVGPAAEVCDCQDNDCNGSVDDDAVCPGGTDCVDCGCYQPCGAGEFPCAGGYVCDPNDHHCKPERPCAPCADGSVCDPLTGLCRDRCLDVTCPPIYVCTKGVCVGNSCVEKHDCKPCDANGIGERCDPIARTCVRDLCCRSRCGDGAFCEPSDGSCKGICAGPCRAPLLCDSDGRCVPTACGTLQCGELQVCDPSTGDCVPDLCRQAHCVAGLACVNGQCVEDLCPQVHCPDGYRCVTDALDGHHDCAFSGPAPLPDDAALVVGAGSGGFALGCSLARGSATRTPGSARLLLCAIMILVVGARARRRG